MIPTTYSVETEHTSPKFARAFALGCGGDLCKSMELQPGDVALFGSPQLWPLLRHAQAEGRNWYYGDHAYFGRQRYYRITKNALQVSALDGNAHPRRFDDHFIRIRPWSKAGRYILLCPNSAGYFRLHGMTVEDWTRDTIHAIRKRSSREIRIRWKTDAQPFEQQVRQAWCVVCFTSVCGVHAALAGVPSFATAPCAARDFGTDDLSRIEKPVYPDNRLQMARVLANNQWTLDEIQCGRAWEALQ